MCNYSMRIFEIEKISGAELIYGGKALNLSRMEKLELLIPYGFGFSKAALDDFCEFNHIESQAAEITGLIHKGKYPAELLTDLEQVWKEIRAKFGEISIIVRSSAIGEDSDSNSFAGIYESFINIRDFEVLKDCVKKCWMSYYSLAAREYRRKYEIEESGIAFIIQVMIDSDASGVLFTQNPISLKKEAIIEVCLGMNSVVDGCNEVDRYIIDETGKVKIENIAEKKRRYIPGNDSESMKIEAVERQNWLLPVLNTDKVIEIWNAGNKLAQNYQKPCDIEWVMKGEKIYYCQSRGITMDKKEADKFVCRFDLDDMTEVECSLLDRYSEPACTCYLSLLKSWEEVVYLSFYSKDIGRNFKEVPLLFYFNRVYWNLKYQKNYFDDIPFNNKLFKDWKKKYQLIKLIKGGYKNWYGRLEKYEILLDEYSGLLACATTLDEMIAVLKQTIDTFCNFIGIDHYQFLGIAQITFGMLKKELSNMDNINYFMETAMNRKWYKNMTILSNKELQKLAEKVINNASLKEIFIENRASEIAEIIIGHENFRDFRKDFDEFMANHGHRGTSCDDLYYPHWSEAPDILIDLIKQFVENPDVLIRKDGEPNNENESKRIIKNHLKINEKNKINLFIKEKKIHFWLEMMAEYMPLRENQRYYFDKSWVILRKILLKIGTLLYKQKVLYKPENIFHLEIGEIYGCLDWTENSNIKDIVDYRESIMNKNKKITPPYLIKDADFISIQNSKSKKSYKATGISPGKAFGKTRVVASISDLSKVQYGEIVVVSNFHPSWTPILSIASGLIMDYGNVLSHGAIVAREYHIPVVVFNGEATRFFKEGTSVEIDGSTGRIRKLENVSDTSL